MPDPLVSQPSATNTNKHLPGLNGIRFLGALSILLIHLEIFKTAYGLYGDPMVVSNSAFINSWKQLGEVVIKIFFALSAFLITHMLLEQKRKGVVSLKAYFLRRAFRILPMYYFLLVIGIVVLPLATFFAYPKAFALASDDFFIYKLLCFLLMVPHFPELFHYSLPFVQVSWSVGVEIGFYLIVPFIVVGRFKKKWALLMSIFIADEVVYYLFKYHVPLEIPLKNGMVLQCYHFWERLSITSFLAGAVMAVIWHFNYARAIKLLKGISVQLISIITVAICLVFDSSVPLLHELCPLGIAILIFNIATNAKSQIKLRGKFWERTGEISYIFYLLHPIVIVTSLKVYMLVSTKPLAPFVSILISMAAVVITYAISFITYSIIEKPAITYAHRFK